MEELNEIKLGTLKASFDEYRDLLFARYEKVGNVIWVPEWKNKLNQREIDVITFWDELIGKLKKKFKLE